LGKEKGGTQPTRKKKLAKGRLNHNYNNSGMGIVAVTLPDRLMKYLQDYINENQTKALDEAGAFFAFSKKQFDEAKKEGVVYVNGPAGLICPKNSVDGLAEKLNEIHQNSIKADLAENGKDKIILRELNNHEAFYTQNIDDTANALADYPITKEEILTIYKKNK